MLHRVEGIFPLQVKDSPEACWKKKKIKWDKLSWLNISIFQLFEKRAPKYENTHLIPYPNNPTAIQRATEASRYQIFLLYWYSIVLKTIPKAIAAPAVELNAKRKQQQQQQQFARGLSAEIKKTSCFASGKSLRQCYKIGCFRGSE